MDIPEALSRRGFLARSGALGAGLSISPTLVQADGSQPTGAFRDSTASAGQASVDPRRFGAKFDGVTDDTFAWQAAIDYSALNRIPLIVRAPGTSVLVCRSSPRGTYGNLPDIAVYQAVDINHSGLAIDLGGARVRLVGRGRSDAVNYAFGTSKNMMAGTLKNFSIRNGTLDFDPTGDSSINKRALYLVGVDGIEIEDILLTSGGRRAGATITLQNCRGVRMRNLRGVNVTQGMNLSYVDDVELDTLSFDNFSEAIDFDRVVSNIRARNLDFKNGGPHNQCIDLNSVRNVYISGVKAYNVGNIALINYKTTTPQTFREYVSRSPVRGFTPSENVTIEGVTGEQICWPASRTIPFRLGNDQKMALESASPLKNITLRRISLEKCPSFIPIELVENALLEDVRFAGAVNPIQSMGCIDIRSDFPDTPTSVVLRNVLVELGVGATCGIRANSPRSLKLASVEVVGPSIPGAIFFDFAALGRNTVSIDLERVSAVATGGHGAIAYRFGDQDQEGYGYSVALDEEVRATGPFSRRYALNGKVSHHMKCAPRVTVTCPRSS
jgi:hypothetical protein